MVFALHIGGLLGSISVRVRKSLQRSRRSGHNKTRTSGVKDVQFQRLAWFCVSISSSGVTSPWFDQSGSIPLGLLGGAHFIRKSALQ